jgi:DNA mismatch repair protein MutL
MIKILSKNIVNKIAAGEVVERPASIVKELVENSIDAFATKIEIFVAKAGTEKIQVIDNGVGISQSDLKNLFQKHATSKISQIDDLDNIKSYGFRGEALASISSVAEITLQTKSKEDDLGVSLEVKESKIISQKPSPITIGTNISVQNLFENIPARKKFLKSLATENKQIIEIINKFILSNPQIQFKINIDGSSKEYIPEEKINRISKILKIDKNEIIHFVHNENIKLECYLVHPKVFLKNKNQQYIFVNGRDVNDNLIGKAVKDGFDTFLMKNQYPGYVLFLEINPKDIDVNVHPRKIEVRFADQSEIYKKVRFTINNFLLRHIRQQTLKQISNQIPQVVNEKSENYKAESFEEFLNHKNNSVKDTTPSQIYFNKKALDFSKEIIEEDILFTSSTQNTNDLNLDLENATQLLNSYIITSNGKEILMIDQHAASERFFYEKYLNQLKNHKVEKQTLLIPSTYEYDENDIQIIFENIEILNELGFEIESFGKDQIRLIAVPAFLRINKFEGIFLKLINEILENQNDSNAKDEIYHLTAAMLACHTAVRFGDKLTKQEIIQILKNLLLCEDPYNCPHGRPVIQDHTQYDIEKRFKRCGL